MLGDLREFASTGTRHAARGRLVRVAGLVMEASGLRLPVGAVCSIEPDGGPPIEAEVVGFDDDRLYLMPLADVSGVRPGARVVPVEEPVQLPTLTRPRHPARRSEDRSRWLPGCESLLGRVVDALGRPLDGRGPLVDAERAPMLRRPINAMEREPVREPLDTGVRAINALLSVGRGQRLGLFAGSGVGKSVLLGMMARHTSADVTVVGLIGERGREVKEFIEDILGPEGLARAVVVAAPADASPVLRMQGAVYATSIAEQFRDRGLNVLLLMDSLTRYAMAAREVALAIGEPPATKGYPPSVFARLPSLVERAGNGRAGGGSITGFYTVLTEGDDQQDPIADSARAILDGHLVLDRSLAESGHYPAIDIEQSISRVMHQVTDARQLRLARRLKALWSRYRRSRDLISVGAYVQGSDPETDLSIALMPRIAALLQQGMDDGADFASSRAALDALIGPTLPPDDGRGG
ncbi:MAG TPA: flagellar protein export ATPase FliI [Burkholderiaceae bacterium]|nr:flagellar protein export ATPase FliI [Burkholderiaceae bacterium]